MITLTVIGVVSVMVVGFCSATQSSEEVSADCVDMNDRLDDGSYAVVDESYCDDDDGNAHYYVGSRGAYHWYYGGNRVGTRVRGGTSLRPSDVNISSRGGRDIQRGGFGSRWSGGG
ncbi:hypothetical protein [Nonomuraea sp. NPDC048916]|uniref:hypothetical protein n=1 Tax=Nonomuraea sp. NPDC048916 TaxID=3154232 RepID=UPI0033D5623D